MIGEWTEANVGRLKDLWSKGYSASQIAAELDGDISRSAVLGKAMRLKLSRRRDETRGYPVPRLPSAPATMSLEPATPRPRHNVTRLQETANGHDKARQLCRTARENLAEKIDVAESELPPILRGEAPDGTGIQLRELTDLNCHWPRGDPLKPDFEFCGRKAIPGMPYCAHHCRISYAPAQDRHRPSATR